MARTPALPGQRPVSRLAREGEHTGLQEYPSVKRAPAAASRSMCGVRTCALPMQERSP